MKIVGFESSEGLRLGVVEGDNVIDLQAVDAEGAVEPRATCWPQSNGDLKALGDLAKKRARRRPQAPQGPEVRRCRSRGRRRSSASG